MFALEIQFRADPSANETVMIRRPQALIGAQEFAHIVLEDMRELDFQVRVAQDLSRRLRITAVPTGEKSELAQSIEGIYEGEVTLELGPVTLNITSIDSDLIPKDEETPDRAGVRILRRASSYPSPFFPAVVVRGAQPIVFSFDPETPLLIGRSNQCPLRLESADISGQHARIGFENGEFWVEDLGSKNGTFVNGQQVSGRIEISPLTTIMIGREVAICGVIDERQISDSLKDAAESGEMQLTPDIEYPLLVSLSEVARPARLPLSVGVPIHIGRDPTSDIWLGAPHVSRLHLTVTLNEDGSLVIRDYSTNGTFYESVPLEKDVDISLPKGSHCFDFGGGVTVAICQDEKCEQRFIDSSGSALTFADQSSGYSGSLGQDRHYSSSQNAAPFLNVGESNAIRVLRPFILGFKSLQGPGKAGVVLITLVFILVVYLLWRVIAPVFRV